MKFKNIINSEDDWRELEVESVYLNPFITYGWGYACVKHHPQVKEGKVAILEKNNKVIALLPIFKPINKGDYAGILIRSGYEEDYDIVEFFDEVCKKENLYPYPQSDGVIDSFFIDNFVSVLHRKSAWQVNISNGYDLFIKKVNKKFLSNIRRLLRKLNREVGEVEFLFELGDRDLKTELDKFLFIHASKWGNRWTGSEMYNFLFTYSNMIKENLWPCFIRIGNEDLYSGWNFIFRDTAYLYLTGFNEKYKKFKVGHILNNAVIEKCCYNGLSFVNFLKGDSNQKHYFGCDELKRYVVEGRKT